MCAAALSAFGLCAPQPAAGDLTLIKDGQSEHEILIPVDAPRSIREAADELQRLLLKSTGARLPIVDSTRQGRGYISIGATGLTDGVPRDDLPHDAFMMQVEGSDLLLFGRDEDVVEGSPGAAGEIRSSDALTFYNLRRWRRSLSAGSYNAVIEFARRYLGARWYMPGPLGEEVEIVSHLRLPGALNERVSPHFAMRRFDYTDYDPRAVRAALSGKESESDLELVEMTTRWGRRLRHTNNIVLGNGHGWRQWIPADQYSAPWISDPIDLPLYGERNPAFFALVNGQRQTAYTSKSQHGGQLCVANPSLIETYAENIIAYARKHPGDRMFSLAQNDGGHHCECDLCLAWDPEGAGPSAGDVESPFLTDRMLRFQNAVAARVLAEIPDAHFTVTAYHSTGRAPLQQIANTRLHVIGYYNYLPYRFYIKQKRLELEDALAGWADATGNYYFSSFYFAYGNYSYPWSSVETLQWMFDLMLRHGHQGLNMYYGAGGTRPPVGQLGPDMWIASQLLWEPHRPVDALRDEWYLGCFGPEAGPLVRAYFDTIADAMAREIARFPGFWRSRGFTQRQIDLNVYPLVRDRCAALIDSARIAVADRQERYRWRVEQIARNWRYTELTLDAMAALRDSRIQGTEASLDRALELGRVREAFLYEPANRLAVARESVHLSQQHTSLDILTELPAGKLPTLAVPLLPSGSITIDGDLGDPSWDRGAAIDSLRHNRKSGPVDVGTDVRVLRSEDGLYIRVRCEEPDIEGMVVVDDSGRIWKGDTFEVFIAPAGGDGGYYQFLVNPHGSRGWRAHRGDTGVDASWKPEWHCGASMGDDGWGVELFIPWTALDLRSGPTPGDLWRGAFYRKRYTGSGSESAWSPTGGVFAQPHLFGRLTF